MSVDAADVGAMLQVVPGAGDELERRYAADAWQAGELGVAVARGRGAVSFTGIGLPWLREAAKRWARQRLASGCAFNTIRTGVLAFKRFSSFLACCQPPVEHPHDIDRALLERYLAWLAPLPLADSTKALSRVLLRAFLEENRRYLWVRPSRLRRRYIQRSCPAGATRCPASSPSSSWASWSPRRTSRSCPCPIGALRS